MEGSYQDVFAMLRARLSRRAPVGLLRRRYYSTMSSSFSVMRVWRGPGLGHLTVSAFTRDGTSQTDPPKKNRTNALSYLVLAAQAIINPSFSARRPVFV